MYEGVSRGDYFQKATDGITLLWLFHQDRVRNGFIPPVVNWWDRGFSGLNAGSLGDNPLLNFRMGAFYSIRNSLLRLEDFFTVRHFGYKPRYSEEPIAPYFEERLIADIFADIRGLSYKHAIAPVTEEVPGGVLGETLEFGIEAITQLRAVEGLDFKAVDASMLSKVSAYHIGEANTHIGIKKPLREGEVDYTLFVPGRYPGTNLDLESLRAWGMDDALGCPAAKPISRELRDFFRKCGVSVDREESIVKGTMLTEYARSLGEAFGVVDEWFSCLSEREKNALVRDDRRILDGSIWRERIEAVKTQSCSQRSESRQ